MEKLLAKYIRNECSLAEQQWVLEWLRNPANESHLQNLMRQHWDHPVRPVGPEPDWQRMWKEVSQKVESLPEPSISRTVWRQVLHTALWVSCIVAVGFIVHFVRKAHLPDDAVYRSGVNKPLKIQLADQSIVILNRNSKLVVSADWSGPVRDVWLEGEAFFIIEEQPKDFHFTIHTADKLVKEANKVMLYVSQRGSDDHTVVERGNTAMQSAVQEMLLKQVEVPEEAQDDSPMNELELNPLRRFFPQSADSDN